MTTIVIDGLNEDHFRRSIETRLREGRAGDAIERLRALLAPYAGPGGILPERFLSIDAADLTLRGWNALGQAVGQHDQPGHPVTGLSIAFGWPGEEVPEPDAKGILRPHVETSYFTDAAFPFSRSGREDLLEGYSFYGCSWSGDAVATDLALSLEGVDDLYDALSKLEARLLASDEPDEEGIRAGSLGACLLSALLVQAVNERIARDGLPRPLCVMAGSSEVYPYFDAPVVGVPEEARKAAEAEEILADAARGVPGPRYSSLTITKIPRGKKRAALVLDESAAELANRIATLRSLDHSDSEGEARELNTATLAAGLAGPSPLLTKKSPRRDRDLHNSLGPRVSEPRVDEPLSCEQGGPLEPTLPAIRGGPIAGPEFARLEPELDQRLQSLLSGYTPTMAVASEPAPLPVPINQPTPSRPSSLGRVEDDHHAASQAVRVRAEPIALPAPVGLRARVRAWLRRQGSRRLGQGAVNQTRTRRRLV